MLDLSGFYTQTALSKPLQKRLTWTLARLALQPEASLPNALGESGYRALMRVLPHLRDSDFSLLQPVYEATRRQLVAGERVLCLEDTTECAFGGKRGRQGLPRLNRHTTGFLLHAALLVRPCAVPRVLGPASLDPLTREPSPKGNRSSDERYLDPDKESLRWQRTVERTEERFGSCVTLVHVRDREGDDYAPLCAMVAAGHRFVQRQRQPRRLAEAFAAAVGERKTDALWAHEQGTLLCEVQLSERGQGRRDVRPASAKKIHPARKTRLATLRFAAQRVALRCPYDDDPTLPAELWVNLVRVWEPQPPEGEEPIEWYLQTTEPIETEEQIRWVIEAYRTRWVIEEFFKALKTGCTYQELQSESVERLVELLGFYAPIACTLLDLRTLAKLAPQEPAETVLSSDQLQALGSARNHGLLQPRHQPTPPKTVQEALDLVARLGGHLGKRGEAGWQVLMRGMVALHERTVGYALGSQFAWQAQEKKLSLPEGLPRFCEGGCGSRELR